jgi:shikimate kinase
LNAKRPVVTPAFLIGDCDAELVLFETIMTVLVQVRRQREQGEGILLIGPGGVGKSTVGALLAGRWGWDLLDLDLIFCAELGTIGPYIAERGYEAYRVANLDLAQSLVSDCNQPAILVTSSGFLAAPEGSEDRRRSLAVLRSGYSITLLPSLDINIAAGIVVERQVKRPFGFTAESEAKKFHARFAIYRDAGDMLVASSASPREIADAVSESLGFS